MNSVRRDVEYARRSGLPVSVYDIGKPLVVEETFPLNCTLDEMDRFVDAGKDRVDGWISHYFGYTIQEHEQGAEPAGTAPDAPFGVTVAQFLAYWRDKGQSLAQGAGALGNLLSLAGQRMLERLFGCGRL
jgi:hypothetical protein